MKSMKTTAIKLSALAFILCAASQVANAQITTTPSTLAFTTTVGNASTAQALTINATGPLGAIVVTAPTGFEISTNATTGFAPSVTLGNPGGRVQSVYRGSFATNTGSVWENGNGSEFPNNQAFAAITSNGSVASWGSASSGGNSSVATRDSISGTYSYSSATGSLTSNVTAIYSNQFAFAALKTNGSVVTWGDTVNGGNSTIVNSLNSVVTEGPSVFGSLSSNVTRIYSTGGAFAALKMDGSVVTWGKISSGGNSTSVLINALNGSDTQAEGQSVAGLLSSNVTSIYSNWGAFAALKNNGSVVTWGNTGFGGNSSAVNYIYSGSNMTVTETKSVASNLTSNVTALFSNAYAFAALKNNGSVIAWGDRESGGNKTVTSALDVNGNWTVSEGSSVEGLLTSNVSTIYSSAYAFAALKNNGSVVTWGSLSAGGNASVVTSLDGVDGNGLDNDSIAEGTSVSSLLNGNVIAIYSNLEAFAALKSNGSVVTWGNVLLGGNASVVISSFINGNQTISQGASVSASLSSGVVAIYSNEKAFAALKENGSVVTWGDVFHGGNSTVTSIIESGDSATYNSTTSEISSVAGSLSSDVTAIYSNSKAFAALKKDGSVVAWGDISSGGNLTQYDSIDSTEGASVASQLSSDVIAIYSTRNTFSALKNDGSVVYWGDIWSNLPTNIGPSLSALPALIYVRLASSGNTQTVNGDLVFSSLTNTDDTGVEIDSLPLSGTVTSGSSGFTGSTDNSGSGGSISGGGGGGSTEVKKSKKGKGKSSSAKKSKGSKKSSAKNSSGSKSSSGKKSGGKKAKKK